MPRCIIAMGVTVGYLRSQLATRKPGLSGYAPTSSSTEASQTGDTPTGSDGAPSHRFRAPDVRDRGAPAIPSGQDRTTERHPVRC
jgi:hypothetical protein